MYELKNLFDKYFAFGGSITQIGNSYEILPNFEKYLTEGVFDRDCPDGYFKISNNEILIMEHFCFDSTTKIKGSESLAELARIERENNTHDVIKCSININNYWENLKENYIRHCSKVDKYKSNLILEGVATKNTIFKVAFFIEDVTPLGNIDMKTMTRVHSIFCDKFIDLFEKCSNVDYIFAFSEVGSNKEVLFVTQNDIEELRRNEIKINSIELIPWEPQVRFFSVNIPNKIEDKKDA